MHYIRKRKGFSLPKHLSWIISVLEEFDMKASDPKEFETIFKIMKTAQNPKEYIDSMIDRLENPKLRKTQMIEAFQILSLSKIEEIFPKS